MAMKPLPSPEVLRQLLRYEPETGKLFWKERDIKWFTGAGPERTRSWSRWNKQFSGKEALTADNCGYRAGRIFERKYQSHRVVWALVKGAWPSGLLDHIDGDRRNNRIENLREVSDIENCRNTARRSDNASGHVGVSWYERKKKWRAYVAVNGKQQHLGFFISLGDAVAARKEASDRIGFHENHGREVGD